MNGVELRALARVEKERRMSLVECGAGLNDHGNVEAFLELARRWVRSENKWLRASRRYYL